MTVGHAVWPDQLDAAERALLRPGVPANLERSPDVLVVGGGILGCATAAACIQAGLGSVVLLERDALGAGASGGAAGLIQPEGHVGVDPPEFVEFMRQSLAAWHALHASWPGGVGLLPLRADAARVNPLRAIARLAAALPFVATGVGVTDVEIRGSRIDVVHASIGDFHPRQVVFATGMAPVISGLRLELQSLEVKGHMVCSAPTSLAPRLDVSALVTKIENGRLLVGGTLDVGDNERVVRPEVAARLWQEVVAAWPEAAGASVEYTWACFRPAHPDHLPVIDRVPDVDNAWLTSGHYKTGIMCAPGTANALAAWLACGSPPPEIAPFALGRFSASAA